MLNRAFRFAARNAIALLALFVALGGASYAASGAFKASTPQYKACVGESHVVVLKTGRRPCGQGKKTIVWNQKGPAGAKGATGVPGAAGAAGAAGAGGANGFSALSNLPSGASESGEFNAGGESLEGFYSEAHSYSIPLSAPLDSSHTIYVTTGSAPNCPGVGQAARGFLCIYSVNRENFTLVSIFTYDSGKFAGGSGRFGFDLEWELPKSFGFDVGTWTVTAP